MHIGYPCWHLSGRKHQETGADHRMCQAWGITGACQGSKNVKRELVWTCLLETCALHCLLEIGQSLLQRWNLRARMFIEDLQ